MSAVARPQWTPAVAAFTAADTPAIERYGYQLFCDAAEAIAERPNARARRAAAALDPKRLQPSTGSAAPAVPLAFQVWISHLLWLEETLERLNSRAEEITAAEMAGLTALARARSRFTREHRLCPHCEAVNPRAATRCRRCGKEF